MWEKEVSHEMGQPDTAAVEKQGGFQQRRGKLSWQHPIFSGKGERYTHGYSLALSREMPSGCSLQVEFLTHMDASIDSCFPYSCTGKSVFPKYDESDGQVDPEVHLGITTNQGTTLQSLIAGIFYNHRAFLPLWCVHLDVLLTTPK